LPSPGAGLTTPSLSGLAPPLVSPHHVVTRCILPTAAGAVMRPPHRLCSILLLGLALACAGTPPAPDTRAADAQAIRDIDTQWNEWLKTKNASAITAVYDSAGILMPPGMPAVRGLDNIRAFWAQIWALNATLQLAVENVEVDGNLAVDRGTWTWEQPLPDGS